MTKFSEVEVVFAAFEAQEAARSAKSAKSAKSATSDSESDAVTPKRMSWEEFVTHDPDPAHRHRRPMGELLVELAERHGLPVFAVTHCPTSANQARSGRGQPWR